ECSPIPPYSTLKSRGKARGNLSMQTSSRVRASGMNPRRRDLIRGACALLASTVLPVGAAARRDPEAAVVSLEAQVSGRIGVAALDTGRGTRFGYRQDERFALCSTFKLPLAANVLSQVDAGRLRFDESVHYDSSQLLGTSPITRAHAAEGALSVET